MSNIVVVQAAGFSVKLLLLVLESQSKAPILKAPYRNCSPEETVGVLSRSVLWWINSLLVTGYQELLTGDDLPQLGHDLESENLRERMKRAWDSKCKFLGYKLIGC